MCVLIVYFMMVVRTDLLKRRGNIHVPCTDTTILCNINIQHECTHLR